MIPELANLSLILALCLAVVQGIVPLLGAWVGDRYWMGLARPAAWGQCAFVGLAFLGLIYSLLSNDFSVSYVAHHSNTALPWYYKISAAWAAHEGSLLLWAVLLAAWTLTLSVRAEPVLPDAVLARVLAVLGLVSAGFLIFLIKTSNPFARLLPQAPSDGQDLNPLLQDVGLILHPPLLYMGYVGFAVTFAFAIEALLSGRLDGAWARWVRPWALAAWCFLGLGIVLGSWWAYYELGWGGWWFWDPVENASLMPWLVGAALVHSLAATERRGVFKSWTLLLAVLAFSLSLLGTFLVRSGVLTSVHAFASDPERGRFILLFLGLVVGSSLALFAARAPAVHRPVGFEACSRETFLLLNNLLLSVAMATVLLGTLYPLALDALVGTKLSVGAPYFNAMFLPLMALLLAILPVGVHARWRNMPFSELLRRLRPVLLGALGSVLVWIGLGRLTHWSVVVTVLLLAWVVLGSAMDVWDKRRHWVKARTIGSLPLSYWGMHTAHIGLVVCALGMVLSTQYSVERDVRMFPNETAEVGTYRFRLEGVQRLDGPNYRVEQASITVTDLQGAFSVLLHPEKRSYQAQQMPMTEAAIAPGLTQDIYVALGEPLEAGAWAVRVQIKPFIRWIWLGGLLTVVGGGLAAWDRRCGRFGLLQTAQPSSSVSQEV